MSEHPEASPHPESESRPSLLIVEPQGDKQFMVAFDTQDVTMIRAYNAAIRRVLTEHHLQPFHQIGHEAEPGYHAWEVWQPTGRQQLESLLPEIEQRIPDLLELFRE